MNRKQRRAEAKTAPDKGASTSVQALFGEAVQRHQTGNLAEAERLYRRILAIDSRHADSLHLLGVIAAQAGRFDQAVDLIGKAVRARPDFAPAHYNLGGALRELGRNGEAASAYRRALDLQPDYIDAAVNLGLVLHRLGRNEEALAVCHRVVELKPGFAEAHNNLGNALRQLGRDGEATAAFARAIALKPGYAEAHNNLGNALAALSRDAEAIDALRRAVALKPDYAEAYNNLGSVLRGLGRGDEALDAYRRAIAFRPGFTEAQLNLSVALQEFGRAAEAMAVIDQVLASDPTSSQAWYIRADLKTFAASDPDIARMEALLTSADARRLDDDDRGRLEFSLAKAWMDVGDADRAFPYLEAGNRRRRAALDYDVEVDIGRFGSIARTFTPELMGRFAGAGDASDLPVFIVGMLRSGTTLVEQILASHPQVHGAGELTVLNDEVVRVGAERHAGLGYPDWLPGASGDDLAELGRAYVERVRALAVGRSRVVDKMPANFQHAGLIALALPNARIIHCRRDPIDTCLSCYSKAFKAGQDFTYDLRDLGLYYSAYDRLMAHWRELLPSDRFIEVNYEDVIGDLEGQARRLIDFCGLDWDEACLSFHQTARQVRTASVNQVRQPLYRTSVARWKPYTDHLGPLITALGGVAKGR